MPSKKKRKPVRYCAMIGEMNFPLLDGDARKFLNHENPRLVMSSDGNPFTMGSPKAKGLEKAAREHLGEHPEEEVTIRRYHGPTSMVVEVAIYGQHMVSKKRYRTFKATRDQRAKAGILV